MNRYQEALNKLNTGAKPEEVKVLQELIDLVTVEKYVECPDGFQGHVKTKIYCPTCGKRLPYKKDTHCKYCGQLLKHPKLMRDGTDGSLSYYYE